MTDKACAIVLHPDGAPMRLLMFEHPSAGTQIVKGTIEPGENPERAAARELFEEAGVETLSALRLGQRDIVPDQTWHFVLCRPKPPLRDQWRHYCRDDGGHLFRFFWVMLEDPPKLQSPFDAAFAFAKDCISPAG